jgi:hypothetical protein
MRKRTWYLVVDSSGHHRAVAEGHRLRRGELVIGPPYAYKRCCEEANNLNEVMEVMTA